MRTANELLELYFYKGKYRTDEGLKRELIKDGTVWVSRKQNYYLLSDVFEYYYSYDYLMDYVTDNGLTTRSGFRKWLKQQISEGKCEVLNTRWYHCDANDGIGTMDWWDTREAIIDGFDRYDPKWPDDFIEQCERTIESYADEVLTEEEWQQFLKLPEEKQCRIAMKWRIAKYNHDKEKEGE